MKYVLFSNHTLTECEELYLLFALVEGVFIKKSFFGRTNTKPLMQSGGMVTFMNAEGCLSISEITRHPFIY